MKTTFHLFLFYFLSVNLLAQNQIIVDGFFNDWIEDTFTFNDESSDTPGVDLLNFSVCNDDKNIYFRLKLDSEIDLSDSTDLYARIRLFIDSDNNTLTGYPTNGIGSEYGIDFNEKFIWNDLTYPFNVTQEPLYWLNVVPLPTITADEFEIAVDRTFFSDTISFFFKEDIDGDKMPDANQIFSYVLNNNSTSNTPQVSFSKSEPTNLRLMSYNVLNNGILNPSRREQFKRVISSVDADLYTFNECGGVTLEDMVTFFSEFSSDYWYMYKFSGGDISVSRYPILQEFNVDMTIGATLINLPDSIYSTDILLINGHLACCSNDVSRQISADKFIQFIHNCKNGLVPLNTPFIFSGDMNLVGYKQQYETILNGSIFDTSSYGIGGFPDWDNTPLIDQVCVINESNQSYTWRDRNPSSGAYPPGRLDFIFYSNSVLTVDKSFTISTIHMSEELLSANNLSTNDTEIASDHLPVVADFMVKFSDEYILNNGGNNSSDCSSYSIYLSQGWNMIGFGCINSLDSEIVFSPIIDHIVIVKDNLGNAYLPEWNFNGIGDLERGYGYQIKITEVIENYNICE